MSQPAIVAAGLVAALAAFTSFSIHKIEEGNVVTVNVLKLRTLKNNYFLRCS